jgi:signal transduction histidine kinase
MSEPSVSPRIPEVLVVDDDPRNRKLLESYLTTAGYRVRCAADGPAALQLAHEQCPDIVLLDVMMSPMNGLEVCRELKGHPRTRLSQVMLVTALDGTPHKVEGLDCGADDYVAKPVRREEFLAKVRSLLRANELMAELAGAREELAARNAELEELQQLKETLTQTLVHDLKNPLTAVIGNLGLLERRVEDEDQLRLLTRCRQSAERMHRMILDLLDISRLEEGRLSPKLEEVDAIELLRRAIEDIEAAANARQVTVCLEAVDSPGPCTVQGDGPMLRRVVDNLVTNALEHSPTDGEVTIRVGVRDEGIELSFGDEGPGIPEEHREAVFEKFARLETKQGGVTANRGLGLTFCRLAVEAHGGVIWVESSDRGGALFRTLLPAVEA